VNKTQRSFFDAMRQAGLMAIPTSLPIQPSDPAVADGPETIRLTGQNGRILARLRQGPATNDELARIARKYTSRISDLRKAGHSITVMSRDRSTGLATYRLDEASESV